MSCNKQFRAGKCHYLILHNYRRSSFNRRRNKLNFIG